MRRSTVLSLPIPLAFPAIFHLNAFGDILLPKTQNILEAFDEKNMLITDNMDSYQN